MKRLSDQTLYEILEVSVEAAPEEIERAYARARDLYGPGSLATYSLVTPDEALLLTNRIEEAKAVLLDADARGRYDERIGVRPRATPPPSVTHGAATPWPPPQAATPPLPAVAPDSPPPPSPPSAPEAVAAADFGPAAAPLATPVPTEGAQVDLPLASAELPAPAVRASEWPGDPSAGVAGAVPAESLVEPPAAAPVPIALDTVISTPPPGAFQAVTGNAEPPAPVATPASPGAAALTPSPVVAGPVPAAPIPLKHEVPAPRDLLVPEGAPWTGEMLRQVREARGLTVPQLSERTKVTRHHLENIEADRFAALPAPVYLRGILMSLARELRLDGQKVARSYLERLSAALGDAPRR